MNTTQKLIFFTTSSLLILSLIHAAADAKCNPCACGAICNITSPFRLKSDPSNCGHPKFELTCENNATFTYLNSIKYHVKDINYQNSTIRLVDASLNNGTICSFPITSSYPYDFIVRSPYYSSYPGRESSVVLISCPDPMNNTKKLRDLLSGPNRKDSNFDF
ncbi:LEAF RUST 10 DISEASE-RESISTANCE LOCUS RECEPTOR-LIKE PROTEIN KINASE-like 2.8 [Salvia hispanica]|uniref:LEAF RUST 10 DISEASE-RESISTANCE LOCUS RECEPTOR-LIKE PROTEIN KINASE-like 2.8 n=1 Tax=Salvia hispanica TaxID=49212 RepID=UPI00200934FF|nr:LEAF RUST 10 DISEASE-RESISTANCE LOCUS RECEPTOR-LIKE PROTEIN KINASE-like 2.8 [Salvia hispanica]